MTTTEPPVGFAPAVLDALPEQIALIDPEGVIVWVNRSWVDLHTPDGAPSATDWLGKPYLESWANAATHDAQVACLEGFLEVIAGKRRVFILEYPWHADAEERWFELRLAPVELNGRRYAVASHHDITERHLHQARTAALARTDPLTGVANRRRFDEFLDAELRRSVRHGGIVSLVVIDVDGFKDHNDRHGHGVGDRVLQHVAGALSRVAGRATDLVARLGGDEFAIVLGETSHESAAALADAAQRLLRAEVGDDVTVSAGVADTSELDVAGPTTSTISARLLHLADARLYTAKRSGGDTVHRPDALATEPGDAPDRHRHQRDGRPRSRPLGSRR